MKNIKLAVLFFCALCIARPNVAAAQNFDLTSVDAFFSVAHDLKSGKTVNEASWDNLFKTAGYNIIVSHFGNDILKNCIVLAFDPTKTVARDSVLGNKTPSERDMFMAFVIGNYIDMDANWSKLKEFRKTYDFEALKSGATNKLKRFLNNPPDSTIKFPALTIICFDSNGRKLDKGISLDFNLIYKQTPQQTAAFLAHEMFHDYRGRLLCTDFVKSSPAITALATMQNEGMADMVNKTSAGDAVSDPLTPQAVVKQYFDAYNGTPALLAKLDSLTVAHLQGQIDADKFKKSANRIFIFDGHPNGYYMAYMIKRNGLMRELIENVANPVAFARLYNKAAAAEGGYVFSDKFMSYIEALEAKYL